MIGKNKNSKWEKKEMDYQMSRAYIEDAGKYGSVLGLKNMQEMMKRLGNPQDGLKYVHVAGTNGKGSLIAYLYSTLSEAGYKVGRYISPAIYTYRERMEVAGTPVTREKFAEYTTKVAEVIDDMVREGLAHPTPFEIETAVAFLFFVDEKCDLVLLEVGMGGNLDATNIIETTAASVLVSISKDHEDFLGKTVAEIAEKKAGIIKPGAHVITTTQLPEVEQVIVDACGKMQTPLVIADYKNAEVLEENVWGQTFRYKEEIYEISLAGIHQIENAVLALNVLKELDVCGYPTTFIQKKEGLKKASWGGRFSVIAKGPLFIVDGAHNPAAAEKLADSIERYFKGKTIYYIMGVFKDKEYDYVIEKTYKYAKKILTVQTPDNPRALPAEELAKTIRAYHADVQAMKSLEEAVDEAYQLAEKEDVIIAFGSLSYLGELTRIVKGYEGKKND